MIRVETIRDTTLQRAPGTLNRALPYLSPGANTMERILVVEDDHAVQKALRRLFETEGFEIEISEDGQSALEAFRRAAPAAIVLDLRLPLVSGRDVCREIKLQAPTVPIIVLSAASDVSDKVLLLELGADDYVTKPFSVPEMLARIRAALRRSASAPVASIGAVRIGEMEIDFRARRLRSQGKQIPVSSKEFDLLSYLVSHPNRAIPHEELLHAVWGPEYGNRREYLRVFINRLRKKIEPSPEVPQYLIKEPWIGYSMKLPEH